MRKFENWNKNSCKSERSENEILHKNDNIEDKNVWSLRPISLRN